MKLNYTETMNRFGIEVRNAGNGVWAAKSPAGDLVVITDRCW